MLRKPLLLLFFLAIAPISIAQELTGPQLLDKAIAHHDPNGIWKNFQGNLRVTMQTPDRSDRISAIHMDFPKQYFQLEATRDSISTGYTLSGKECSVFLNGLTEVSAADKKKYRLDCERGQFMKNYYTYLYGLPMKLKDPGTILDEKVQSKTFKGKEYVVLKASYDEAVGKDVWYFYFDPKTYALEVYQFYHDEAKNDGEYIILSGTEDIQGIKMPKTRAWYYNSNDKYLGTDILSKGGRGQ
ncbi:DUF6503 family protein [Spongiimicrobium salis]|uniref:DUF6503 family protein n=1 Tax=Spongiimicrobium salis TaxID=1667022 RepID=UPI00374C9146